MPPLTYYGGLPSSTSLTPTSDNRGMPQRKTPHYHSPSQSTQVRQLNGTTLKHRQIRPLTVNEGLQYSPLSSIIPFDSGIVPLPHVDTPSSRPIFTTPYERHAARQSIERLDVSLIQSRGSSIAAQHAHDTLRSLLDPDTIPAFKFKVPRGLKSASQQVSYPGSSNTKPSTRLGPFANMILNSTNITFRYPTPDSPSTRPSRATFTTDETRNRPYKPPVTPETPKNHLHNELAYSYNASISSNSDSNSAVWRTQLKPVVIVPRLPDSFDVSKYPIVGSDSTKDGRVSALTKKRKREDAGYEEPIGQVKDQRAVSDAAFSTLQDLVSEVFEAENNSQLDGALESSAADSFFVLSEGSGGSKLTLAPSIHVKLDSCLHKVISLNRLGEVPVDHLCKLQKLCEGALITAEAVDIGIQSSWMDDDISSWVDRTDQVDAGLRSARTVLRIMSGGREEKQVYSEELIQKILELTRGVMESCLIPVVEARPSGSRSEVFELASSHKRVISQLLHNSSKIMQLLLDLLAKVELAESTVTSIEFFASSLLFVENAHNEKESVLGSNKFETFRRTAMNVVAQVFSRYPEQRRYILDEVLTSLQRLPTTRQHARQFKLGDGKSMQLVSALLMRLVQSSGMPSAAKFGKKGKRTLSELKNGASEADRSSEDEASQSGESDLESNFDDSKAKEPANGLRTAHSSGPSGRSVHAAKTLYESALRDAQYIVNFFVTRASTASKTGDQPHRHLLDIFVEDLTTVLSLPEWPASELILRALVSKMNEIITYDKSTAPAKTMALETLGFMGAAISDVTAGAQQLMRTLENDDSTLTTQLSDELANHLGGEYENGMLLEWTGPYRAVVEYLSANRSDLQAASAEGYIITQWAKVVLWGNHATTEGIRDFDTDNKFGPIAVNLCEVLSTGQWASRDEFDPVSRVQCRLAYSLVLLNTGFCRAFGFIVKVLLDSVSSEHISIRTRSLKSVAQMLEKDPSLLGRTPQVIVLIANCASDQSPMVRDSALVLIGKCILLKPALELDFLKSVLTCSNDTTVGIRKRSIKYLKDIYLRHSEKDVRSVIADSLLQKAQDPEEGVADLAKQIIEELWLIPFWTARSGDDQSAAYKVRLTEQVALIVRTVQRGNSVVSVLYSVLRQLLSKEWKNGLANMNACKAMVVEAVEELISAGELAESGKRQLILHTLTIFARVCPELFTSQQLRHLQPYITNLATAEDLNIFRSVVIILRCVLPSISTTQNDFLKQVQDDLFKNVTKLAKTELDEVCECLWTINGVLRNVDRLIKLELSVLKEMHKLDSNDFSASNRQQELSRLKRYIQLASYFAKHCDFEPHLSIFKASLPWWAINSVAANVVESIRPFCSKYQPLDLRSVALDGIGMICQAWPSNFNRRDTALAFQNVLRDDHTDLQRIVLTSFRDFFAAQDHHVEAKVVSGEEDPLASGKFGGSMTASDNDGAAALIAQGFLKDILRIALSSQGADAVTATEVIASITRQGLVHPKECGPALVALETSTNPRIADIAFQQHHNLHLQHESMFEREYMRAIHEAFMYQKNIVQDPNGFTGPPYRSKLHSMYEVIKTSKSKYQFKFLSSFCSKIDFDITKLDLSMSPPFHLQYAKFLIENLAFFEYGRVEDVVHITSCIEKTVAGSGAGIAHSINTDIFKLQLDSMVPTTDAEQGSSVTSEVPTSDIDPSRLLLLTTGSMILSMLWETRTFIRRLYGVNANQQRRESKPKSTAKDLSKPPTKAQNVSGDRIVDAITKISISLDNRDLALQQCKDFAELLAVDSEVKVSAEGDDEDERGLRTPSADGDGDSLVVPASVESKAGKRKGSASGSGTPQKKKRGRPSWGGRRKSGKSVEDGEDSY